MNLSDPALRWVPDGDDGAWCAARHDWMLRVGPTRDRWIWCVWTGPGRDAVSGLAPSPRDAMLCAEAALAARTDDVPLDTRVIDHHDHPDPEPGAPWTVHIERREPDGWHWIVRHGGREMYDGAGHDRLAVETAIGGWLWAAGAESSDADWLESTGRSDLSWNDPDVPL